MKKKEGWIDLGDGYSVLVEDGYVVRATKPQGMSEVPASVYRRAYDHRTKQYNGWNNVCPIKWETFRKGWKEEKLSIM